MANNETRCSSSVTLDLKVFDTEEAARTAIEGLAPITSALIDASYGTLW